MHFHRRPPLVLTLICLIPSLALADTYVVDASGGPGSDFLDLPEAVAAPGVLDGDTLLVRGGFYTGFSTDKALSIVEEGSAAYINGAITIHDLPPGPWFSIEHFHMDGISIANCAAPVFVEGQVCDDLHITDCADVRIRDLLVRHYGTPADGMTGFDTVIVDGTSRVELVECEITGGTGGEGWMEDAGDGGSGLVIDDDSVVCVALTSVTGGEGGYQGYPEWGDVAGDGGDGIVVQPGAELILSGIASNVVAGGLGGIDAWGWGYDGVDGDGLGNQGSARISGATVTSYWNTGYLEEPAEADPVLTFTRQVGGGLRVEILGPVGGNVRLYLGCEPILPATGSLEKGPMCKARTAIPLGVIGPTGSISRDFSSAYAVAFSKRPLLILQASVVIGGQAIRSSSGSVMHL